MLQLLMVWLIGRRLLAGRVVYWPFYTGVPWNMHAVAEAHDLVTSLGGMRVLPDITLAELHFFGW
ncbi:MAG: hypothetical protein ABF408_02500 [Bifidobacterium aquikefiri]